MKISNLTKDEIVKYLQDNDEEFINQLYDIVRDYCWKNKIYSEDNVQDLIYEILKGINTFDETKSKFTTWAYTVCYHKHMMKIRASKAIKRKANNDTISLNKIIDDNNNIEILDILQAEYNPIENDKREIVNYIYNNNLSKLVKDYFDGKTQDELAIEYGISQPQIARKIKKELKEIREKLNHGKIT